jgi:hypothetical protein
MFANIAEAHEVYRRVEALCLTATRHEDMGPLVVRRHRTQCSGCSCHRRRPRAPANGSRTRHLSRLRSRRLTVERRHHGAALWRASDARPGACVKGSLTPASASAAGTSRSRPIATSASQCVAPSRRRNHARRRHAKILSIGVASLHSGHARALRMLRRPDVESGRLAAAVRRLRATARSLRAGRPAPSAVHLRPAPPPD